jgi:hypothetical protein
MLDELFLLPFDVFIEDFNDVFEIQWKHKDTQRIVLHCEAIAKKKLIVVELTVRNGWHLSWLYVFNGLDSHEGCSSVRKMNNIKLAVRRS